MFGTKTVQWGCQNVVWNIGMINYFAVTYLYRDFFKQSKINWNANNAPTLVQKFHRMQFFLSVFYQPLLLTVQPVLSKASELHFRTIWLLNILPFKNDVINGQPLLNTLARVEDMDAESAREWTMWNPAQILMTTILSRVTVHISICCAWVSFGFFLCTFGSLPFKVMGTVRLSSSDACVVWMYLCIIFLSFIER